MRKNFILITTFLLGLGTFQANAQTGGEYPRTITTATATAGVAKDPRIDILIQKQVYLNTLALRNMPGYRIQVLSTMDRAKAMDAKARLLQLFPDYQTYLSYQSPYFRVRIGDFRDREAAQDLQQELNNYFPNGVFTVRDYIHISPEQLFQSQDDNPEN